MNENFTRPAGLPAVSNGDELLGGGNVVDKLQPKVIVGQRINNPN